MTAAAASPRARLVRIIILVVAAIETLLWLAIVAQYVSGVAWFATHGVSRDGAIAATFVFAISAGPAFVLAIFNRSLFAAGVLCVLPLLALAFYVAALL